MDSLSALLSSFNLSARMFFSGELCQVVDFDDGVHGHLHVLRSGRVRVADGSAGEMILEAPTAILYPRPTVHRLVPASEGTALVCATIESGNPPCAMVMASLPQTILLPLKEEPEAKAATDILFLEAFSDRPGRQAALDRLMAYLVVLALRHALAAGAATSGALAALADAKLAQAVAAVHAHPDQDWTLEDLAQTAGMSRARFAARFRAVAGTTAMDYVTEWRVGLAQSLLRQGKPAKWVARAVGYGTSTALARAFRRKVGLTPAEWMRVQARDAGANPGGELTVAERDAAVLAGSIRGAEQLPPLRRGEQPRAEQVTDGGDVRHRHVTTRRA